MRKRMYMHTIDRLPAFYDGQQVSFMNHGFRGRRRQSVASSIARAAEVRAKGIEAVEVVAANS